MSGTGGAILMAPSFLEIRPSQPCVWLVLSRSSSVPPALPWARGPGQPQPGAPHSGHREHVRLSLQDCGEAPRGTRCCFWG